MNNKISTLSDRPNFIDYSKVIGIYLVVFGHYVYYMGIPFQNSFLWNFVFDIYSFHMPLFFIISGYLFKFVGVKEGIAKGFKQLLIPYFLLSGISLLVGITGEAIAGRLTLDMVLVNLVAIMSASDFFGRAYSTFSAALWFVYSLFFIKLIMEILKSTDYKPVKYFLLLLIIVTGVYTVLMQKSLFAFRVSSTIVGLSFFAIGFYSKTIIKRIHILSTGSLLLSFFVAMLITWSCAYLNIDYSHPPGVSIFSSKYGYYPLLFYISGIAGTMMVLTISQVLARYKIRVILVISNGTILILGLHKLVYLILRSQISSDNFYFILFFSLVVIVLCYILIKIAVKYFPVLLGDRKFRT